MKNFIIEGEKIEVCSNNIRELEKSILCMGKDLTEENNGTSYMGAKYFKEMSIMSGEIASQCLFNAYKPNIHRERRKTHLEHAFAHQNLKVYWNIRSLECEGLIE